MDILKERFYVDSKYIKNSQMKSQIPQLKFETNKSEQFKSTFSTEFNEKNSNSKSFKLLSGFTQMQQKIIQTERTRTEITNNELVKQKFKKQKFISKNGMRNSSDDLVDVVEHKKTKSELPFSQKRIRRVSENFNIYDAPETMKPSSLIIQFQKNICKNSQQTINCFIKETEKFKLDSSNQSTILKYLRECHFKLKQIQRLAEEAYSNYNDRSILENSIQNIIDYSNILKNTGFTIMTTYQMGKLSNMYNNPLQAIHHYKQCKRLSDSDEYYTMKMKCYRQLGELFINIDNSLAKLYLTKFLVSSWKLNNPTRELLAYELLGKFYFYEGNMEKAKQFHLRMMSGICEPKNTRMRLLAIGRLNHGSVGKSNPNKFIEKQKEFEVTSDDEVYEIILPNLKEDKYKAEPRHINLLPGRKSQIQHEANLNIRKLKPEIRRQVDHNTCKDIIQLSHLSPNRNLNIFQTIALNKNQKNSENIEVCLTSKGQKKAKRLIQKYISIIQFVSQKLQQLSHNLIQNDGQENRSPLQRRKAYLIY